MYNLKKGEWLGWEERGIKNFHLKILKGFGWVRRGMSKKKPVKITTIYNC